MPQAGMMSRWTSLFVYLHCGVEMLHDHQFVSSVTKQLNKAQQTPYINKTTHWQLLRQLASVRPGLTPFVSSHVYVTSLVCAHRTRSTNHINPVSHIDRPHQGQRNVNSIKQTLKKLFCLQLFTWESCTYNKQKKINKQKKKRHWQFPFSR